MCFGDSVGDAMQTLIEEINPDNVYSSKYPKETIVSILANMRYLVAV